MKNIESYISSGILEQYVLGELSPEETLKVEALAREHPRIKSEIRQIEETLFQISNKLAVTPDHTVFNAIEDRIAPEMNSDTQVEQKKTDKKTRKKLGYWQYGVAATFTLKLVAMAIAASFWVRWKNTESDLNRLQTRYDQLEQNAQNATQALLAINDPGFKTVILQGKAEETQSRLLTYWNPNTLTLYVNASDLPANAEEQQYQLWGQADGQMVKLGAFDVVNNRTWPQLKPFKGIQKMDLLAVSLSNSKNEERPPDNQIIFQGILP